MLPAINRNTCNIGKQNVNIAIFGCRSLSESLRVSFFALEVVENSRFAVRISTISITVPEIQVFPVLVATSLLSVVVGCYSLLVTC